MRGGWGVRLTPAHCHSGRKRTKVRTEKCVERAGWSAIGKRHQRIFCSGHVAAAFPASPYPLASVTGAYDCL